MAQKPRKPTKARKAGKAKKAKKRKPEKRAFEPGRAGMNTSKDRLLEAIKHNILRPLPQLRACPFRKESVVLAAGGPSLAKDWEELETKVKAGAKLCTVNATHNYCIERGLIPSIHIQLDARPFNVRFVQPPQKKTLYCLASQCHPDVFDALNGFNVAIYHCDTGSGEAEMLDEFYFAPTGVRRWAFIEGGSTVTLRSLTVLRVLGFKRMDVYGFDSCMIDDEHHSYEQKENETTPLEDVIVDGRTFHCHSWMAEQAVDFMGLMKHRGKNFDDIRVHGDGLIAALIQAGHDKQVEFEHGREDGREDGRPEANAA